MEKWFFLRTTVLLITLVTYLPHIIWSLSLKLDLDWVVELGLVLFVETIGLVKILKKYDKRTGDLMRLPFIQKVLQQPFYTTDLLYKLVKESEAMLDRFFPVNETESENIIQAELSEHKFMESLHMKSTIAALRVLKEIRSGSSTVSVFSLPPLQLNGLDETWKKIPLLEQEAK